ncbi:O-antigen ligase family protein [Paenarthrobacter sp. PH39-S1]|uniref:O-antigen ligase family protein n=1 Tax=Paenarthrobacter sp. PH39-S1 TaxID=3046204 RepID=UPI0024B97D45|nr:O-antigen ligase family protein [Paenarthrobacter sp. PH39-S1]MDJ0356118.1 O-antigen ligase family protein [Paenarthrobacter sp. PH39-S1]
MAVQPRAKARPHAHRYAPAAAGRNDGGERRARRLRTEHLPGWPVLVAFAGFPLWWLLGLGDMAWPVFAAVMVYVLARFSKVKAPRGLGVWLLFMLWMLCSLIQIDEPIRIVGFFYRYGLYLAATIVFVYVYNARHSLSERKIFGVLTIFWLAVVVGGYAGLAFPVFELKTPLAYVFPQVLLDNSYVHDMAFRRLTQFNPDPNAYVIAAPRPSAPFLYANGWGNVYSLLTPVVIAYASMVRRERKFWLLVLALPISFVPAFLTLNRGMFLGLGVALVYIGIRAALQGHGKIIMAIIGITAIAGIAVNVLPVQERLDQRTAKVESIVDRGNLYVETFDRTLESPVFGYGAPRPSERAGQPSVGTQGQIWMVMFSHGFVGLGLFLGWLVMLFLKTMRRTDVVGLVCNTIILVSLVEVFYYGILGAGLVIVMVAGALALRNDPAGQVAAQFPARVKPERAPWGRPVVPGRYPRNGNA